MAAAGDAPWYGGYGYGPPGDAPSDVWPQLDWLLSCSGDVSKHSFSPPR